MPQSQMASIKNASAVRNTEPTLRWLRTLSSTITMGVFASVLNSSGVRRGSSSLSSLRMMSVFSLRFRVYS